MFHGQAHIKAQKHIKSKKNKMHKRANFNKWNLLLSIHKEKYNNMKHTEKHYVIIMCRIQSV